MRKGMRPSLSFKMVDFQAEVRKLGTALLIAGTVGAIFGSFEGHEIPLHVDVISMGLGLLAWVAGLVSLRKKEAQS